MFNSLMPKISGWLTCTGVFQSIVTKNKVYLENTENNDLTRFRLNRQSPYNLWA